MIKLAKGAKIEPYFYQIIQQLGAGEGGTSAVYLASHSIDPSGQTPPQLVALKIANVDPDHYEFFRATLDNEVEHLRVLRHPGIVELYPIRGHTLPPNPIYAALTNLPGKPWFSSMEYLAGGSLADLLKGQPKLPVPLALRIAQGLAETLAFIHERGHVHLDIKPENIVFRRPPQESIEPVLIDFGIARRIGQGGLEARTLPWVAPERLPEAESAAAVSMVAKPHPSMDVYALGLVLYRMVTGQLPYSGTRTRLTNEILQGNPKPPIQVEPSLSPAVNALVMAALSRDPAARPTAREMGEHLQPLVQQEEQSGPHGAAVLLVPKRSRKLRTGLMVPAMLGLGFLLLLLGPLRNALPFLPAGTVATPSPRATATARQARASATSEAPAVVASPTRRATATRTREPSATRSSTPGLRTSTPVSSRTPRPTETVTAVPATAPPPPAPATNPPFVSPTQPFVPPTQPLPTRTAPVVPTRPVPTVAPAPPPTVAGPSPTPRPPITLPLTQIPIPVLPTFGRQSLP